MIKMTMHGNYPKDIFPPILITLKI
jgi:hypothetical protein